MASIDLDLFDGPWADRTIEGLMDELARTQGGAVAGKLRAVRGLAGELIAHYIGDGTITDAEYFDRERRLEGLMAEAQGRAALPI